MSTATQRRTLNPVTRVRREAQDEIDRLNRVVKDAETERLNLVHDCEQLRTELQDALRAKLALADQIEKLLGEVQVGANAEIKVREALATFMTNVDADVRILMAAIK